MAEEIHVTKDVLIQLVLPLLVGIIIVLSAYFAWSSLTGIQISEDITDLLETNAPETLGVDDIGMIDYGGIQYTDENSEIAMTMIELNNYLSEKIMYTTCEDCTSCTETNCNSCTVCQGLIASDFDFSFENCEGCYADTVSGTTACAFCYDETSETRFCNLLKEKIKESYVLNKEVDIVNLARGENINVDTLYDALAMCQEESIIIESDETEEEICYFSKNQIYKYVIGSDISIGSYYQSITDASGSIVLSGMNGFGSAAIKLDIRNDNLDCNGVCHSKTKGTLRICKLSEQVDCDENLPDCTNDIGTSCVLYKYDYDYDDSTYGKTETLFFMLPYPGYTNNIAIMTDDTSLTLNGKLIFYPNNPFTYADCSIGKTFDPEGGIKFITYLKDTVTSTNNEGRFKIKISNLITSREKNCEFDIYVCDSEAFANSANEAIVEIYDFMRELYLGDLRYETDSIVSYNYYTFKLDREYSPDEIVQAIEQGFDYWASNSLPYYYDSSINLFNIKNNIGIVYDAANVWDVDEEYLLSSQNGNIGCAYLSKSSILEEDVYKTGSLGNNQDSKIIDYYCTNGICKGNILIKIEFRKNIENRIQPFIWFCGE